jgi:ubiquinone/menaquinone biosynthesis C-methylase UbiE
LRRKWNGKLWYWETAAGQIRWKRRLEMLISHIKPGMDVLEVGCGVGYFTKEMIKTQAKVVAIDISPDLLNVAQEHIQGANVTFKIDNAYDLSFSAGAFDIIVGSSVLHHLDVDQALKEFYRILRPGGAMFFTEPNMANPQIFLQKNIPVFKKLAGDSPDETAFIRNQLRESYSKHKINDVQINPFDFLHPLTPSMLIPLVEKIGSIFEQIPVIREIAGSLYIRARKNTEKIQ